MKTTKSLKSWCVIGIATVALISLSGAWAADSPAINGRWTLNDDDSQTLAKKINELKQEVRDFSYDNGKISDPDKPDPFDSRRSVGDKEWETRRNGGVVNPTVTVRYMVEAESIKIYISGRIIIAYDDGKVKRRIDPNPNGRVHSATGKGTSKDSIGTTMAYFDADAVVIETLTNSAERLVERLEISRSGQLKLTTVLHNPQWKHSITFVRRYDRASD
ncbi:MAG: hypothetical protein O3C28_09260 [Proteobacteria bacterium]|nr:hypothetical protein [Pseudomonadota bacterium]